MPTCDDLIWLYCQDTNTIDGPIAPGPSLEDYGWTHWAYANAPSTAHIDTAIEDTDPDDEAFDDFAEDVEDSECSNCSGTGEGMYDGQSCVVCRGKGFL